MLDRYKQLLDEHDALIDEMGWETERPGLVAAMDALWPKMTASQREVAVAYASTLYQRRISR